MHPWILEVDGTGRGDGRSDRYLSKRINVLHGESRSLLLRDGLNENNDLLVMSEAKQAQKTTAPYGTWASPITTDAILQGVRFTGTSYPNDDLAHACHVLREGRSRSSSWTLLHLRYTGSREDPLKVGAMSSSMRARGRMCSGRSGTRGQACKRYDHSIYSNQLTEELPTASTAEVLQWRTVVRCTSPASWIIESTGLLRETIPSPLPSVRQGASIVPAATE